MTKSFQKLPYLELYSLGNISQAVDLITESHSDIIVSKLQVQSFAILAVKVIFTHLPEHMKPHSEKTQHIHGQSIITPYHTNHPF